MSQKAEKLHVAPPKATQPATFTQTDATTAATTNATSCLKAAANLVLERNNHRNGNATEELQPVQLAPKNTTPKLHSVAMVPDSQLDPLRWPRFVALSVARGVTENEVQAMFSEQDIDDLCEEPDSQLPLHAATIVGAIKRSRRSQPSKPPSKARTYSLDRVRCGRCQFFEFNPQHPSTGLGSCTVRSDVAMGIPARLIECAHYQQRVRQCPDTVTGEISHRGKQ